MDMYDTNNISFTSFALLLIPFLSSLFKSIALFTSWVISSLITKLPLSISSFFTLHLIFQFSKIRSLFGTWFENIWKVTTGTAAERPSIIEFDPQWVQNPPVEAWQKYLTRLLRIPATISPIWALETDRKLPNETYKTEPTGWVSNHSNYLGPLALR